MSTELKVSESKRIAALPTKELVITASVLAQLNAELRVSSKYELKPLQAAALLSARSAGGLLGVLGCGTGKTLLSGLLPTYLAALRPLLLVPAALVEKTHVELAEWATHFRVFPELKVLSYERLSRPSGLKELHTYSPDLIICDEAHNLKSLSSARTLRLGGYLEANEGCKACFLSGTLLNKSIGDIAHLADWALGAGSPFPRDLRIVAEWDALIFGGDDLEFAAQRFKPMLRFGDAPREALFARLSTCDGVVLTDKDTVSSSLNIFKVQLQPPKDLQKMIGECIESGVATALADLDPETLLCVEASSHLWSNADEFVLRALSQMYSGFLYFWEWENNEPDVEWLEARKNWGKTCRKILEFGLEGFDTPGMVQQNFEQLPAEVIRVAERAYHAWFSTGLFKKDKPPKRAVWVSDYLLAGVEKLFKDIQKRKKLPVLIWVNFQELGDKLSSLLNLPYVKGGEEIPAFEGQSLILSIKSHGTGKNLQAYSQNIVASPIGDPATWEQLLARTHRMGQTADEVDYYVLSHTIFGGALSRAKYMAKAVGSCTGAEQRLVYASTSKYLGGRDE